MLTGCEPPAIYLDTRRVLGRSLNHYGSPSVYGQPLRLRFDAPSLPGGVLLLVATVESGSIGENLSVRGMNGYEGK